MKHILYVTNIQVPYRVRFFNMLSRHCQLTVLYERRQAANRDQNWSQSSRADFHTEYLDGISVGNEFSFAPGILRYVLSAWDSVIFGCFNSPSQQMAMQVMRVLKRPYYLNFDGEPFLKGGGAKGNFKRYLVGGAAGYLAAGELSAVSVRAVAGSRPVQPYYFSSLSDSEIERCIRLGEESVRTDTILVVGQYFDYKGLDVALEAARRDPSHRYRFVGLGQRTAEFQARYHPEELSNVEVLPFLQKADLEEEYRHAAMLVLPSRQECWGLVVNEAAAFGTPIVSTWGSGAAVEFLGQHYPQYLAQPGDADSLLGAIRRLCGDKEKERYSRYLQEKSRAYSLEHSVQAHLNLLLYDQALASGG